jgi:uncharacterized repeat protein (TIGR02543 family)
MKVADKRVPVWLSLMFFLACITLLAAACGGRSGPQGVQLTVTKAGDGEGTVRSDPEGIDCGETCQARFTQDALVTLIPLAASNSEFVGWQGCDVPPEGTTCTVTMDEAKSVTAEFKRREVVGGPFNLRILRQGSGRGTVTSIPEGISCTQPGDPGCDASFGGGTEVTLQAQPEEGFVFGGWSGAGCGGSGIQDCTVFMDDNKEVTAIFNVEQNVLSVDVQPPSTGRVFNVNDLGSANPPVECTTDCSYGYSNDLTISLRAEPLDGSQYQFLSWGGACAGTTSQTCNVMVDGDKSVTANFRLVPPSIGSFTVTPSNLTEGEDQSATLSWQVTGGGSITLEIANNHDDTVLNVTGRTSVAVTPSQTTTYTLTARNSSGEDTATRTVVVGGAPNVSSFSAFPAAVRPGDETELSWEVGGDGAITVTITDQNGQPVHQATGATGSVAVNPEVTTTYTLRAESAFGIGTDTTSVTMLYRLSVNKSGNGRGTVTSDPEGISCGSPCENRSADFLDGTQVTLTAAPSGISRFEGWQGACSGSQATCEVTMDGDKEVTAQFRWLVLSVVIEPRPNGGYVTSDPPGIDCGDGNREACEHDFQGEEKVELTAHESPNFDFDDWQDCPASSGTTCTLQMREEEKKISAIFKPEQRRLTVQRQGTGSGAVTSNPVGINCGTDCTEDYDHGTSVTLTATADAATSTFAGWGGACSGSSATCTVSMTQARTVTATFDLKTYTVTVDPVPTNGRITGGGLSCGSGNTACSSTVNHGSNLTLTAEPAAGYELDSWSGDCAGQADTSCTLSNITANKTLSASFVEQTGSLDLFREGQGQARVDGTLQTLPWSGDFAIGTLVGLEAVPADGWAFDRWGGDLSGAQNPTSLLIDEDKVVTLHFTELPPTEYDLTVNLSGTGSGVVTGSGFSCSTANAPCVDSFEDGTLVTLEASADAGSTFAGWTGDCASANGACQVTMDDDKSVTATFNLVPRYTLAVSVVGEGSVGSDPAGISACTEAGGDCSAEFDEGETVTLIATPGEDRITLWGGDCDGVEGDSCTLTMNANRNVTATFEEADNDNGGA